MRRSNRRRSPSTDTSVDSTAAVNSRSPNPCRSTLAARMCHVPSGSWASWLRLIHTCSRPVPNPFDRLAHQPRHSSFSCMTRGLALPFPSARDATRQLDPLAISSRVHPAYYLDSFLSNHSRLETAGKRQGSQKRGCSAPVIAIGGNRVACQRTAESHIFLQASPDRPHWCSSSNAPDVHSGPQQGELIRSAKPPRPH